MAAANSVGLGTYSVVNTLGARVRTVPGQMTSPQLGTEVTETQLEILWTELTGADTGNSEILGYQLYWDAQTGTSDI